MGSVRIGKELKLAVHYGSDISSIIPDTVSPQRWTYTLHSRAMYSFFYCTLIEGALCWQSQEIVNLYCDSKGQFSQQARVKVTTTANRVQVQQLGQGFHSGRWAYPA